ncbi:MAG: helix-turn-helix domain-containing protein [Oligoflexia bacterium]|nr:helix-turn-helix domain-containing protein [Oligoflexia bacterium]
MNWDQNRIKELRQRLNLTQAEFARTLGCRQQTISEWELGMYIPGNAYGRLLDLMAQGALRSNDDSKNEVEKRIGEQVMGAKQVLESLDRSAE